jgi:hypothetical protein
MPTGLTYQSYQDALVTQIPSLTTDPNFQIILPLCIDAAELSIVRDLDLFAQHGLLDLGTLTIGTPTLTASNAIIVVEQLYYMSGPSRLPITPMNDIAINAIYAGAPTGPPKGWCLLPNTQLPITVQPFTQTVAQQIEVGPAPDQPYDIVAMATTRPPTLSASNDTTYISQNLPDLFWAASMIFLAGYSRNYGAMADDPRQAISWEAEYQRLLKSATVEEARKRFQGQAWVAESTAPTVAPPRK